MNTNIQQLTDEAREILVNAHAAMMEEQITQDEYWQIIKDLFLDIGYQTEVISQPRPEGY